MAITRWPSSLITAPRAAGRRWRSCCGRATPARTPPLTTSRPPGSALAQLPRHLRRRVLIRTDSGGGTHEFLAWLTKPGRRLAYSVGFTITEDVQEAILKIPACAWTPAYDAEGQVRPGAWVAEITGMLDLRWPKGMRVIVRKERPHPGAQLRFTDIDGHRFTCFATSTRAGSSPTWNCATAAGPGARTGSAARRTPGCATCPCRASTRTRSGARSSPWPASSWPGCRCSPSTAPPADGSPNGSGCACSPPPGASSAAAAACGSASPPAGPGPPDHRCDHPAAGPRARLTSGKPPLRPERTTRARGTPPTRRDSRAASDRSR